MHGAGLQQTSIIPAIGVQPAAPAEPHQAPRPSPRAGSRFSPQQLSPFLLVLGQLALLVLLVQRFRLETPVFQQLLLVAAVGAVVHHLLPLAWRLPFFMLLSAASVVMVVGYGPTGWKPWDGLMRGGVLLALAGALIWLARLPLSLWVKAGLVGGVGIGLAAFRGKLLVPAYFAPLWPIIASMFMFRIIIYLYDVQHEKERPGWVRSLSYFLMLPNVCFPLFPVVDYKAFCRGHYNDQAVKIYQKGLNWMIRGIIQLVLYRLVYYHIYLDPAHVADGSDVIRCVVSNLFLYLRVSGQFHVVIGLLHLFGFNLPETNRRYLLASSFTDYWRRVNIYWKDFIQKTAFYPAYFRLKGLGPNLSLVLATGFCFIVTWALHSYQWFWIRGTFPVVAQDVIFWSILGLLVIINSLREAHRGRARSLGSRSPSWRERLKLAGRTVGTFSLVCLLWSLWSAESLLVWRQMWSMADGATLCYGVLVLLAIAVTAAAIDGWDALLRKLHGSRIAQPFSVRYATVMCLVPAATLYVLSSGRFQSRIGERGAALLSSLARTSPNEYDQDVMERGYYEDLMDVSRSNPQLAELYTRRPAGWKKLEETDALIPTGDFRLKELAPSKRTQVNQTTIGTNRWGMRDRDREMEKPAGTFRIAVLGASTAMGWGVEDDQTFARVLEVMLNQQNPPGSVYRQFEVLNFGVNGYSAICNLVVLERKALAFQPDAVLVIANHTDGYWVRQRLAKSIRAGVEPPYEYLREVVAKAGIKANTPEQAAMWRLNPHGQDLVEWACGQIAQRSQAAGAVPLWTLMPRISLESGRRRDAGPLNRMAAEAGFIVLDLDQAYEGHVGSSLVVAPWDSHPNATGHRLIARALHAALCSKPGQKMFAERAFRQQPEPVVQSKEPTSDG